VNFDLAQKIVGRGEHRGRFRQTSKAVVLLKMLETRRPRFHMNPMPAFFGFGGMDALKLVTQCLTSPSTSAFSTMKNLVRQLLFCPAVMAVDFIPNS
jgi:hypothetical protein